MKEMEASTKEKKRDLRMKEERSKRKQKEFRKNTTIDEE